jgi:hypothetical protein
MEQDEQEQPRPRPQHDQGGGGGFNIGKFLPFIFLFLFRKPKFLLLALVIGVVLYFLGAFDGCLGGGGTGFDDGGSDVQQFTFGATLDQARFDKAQVFESLSREYGAPGLPQAVSLLRFAPRRLQQGGQGSCVGWASSYAARTILNSRATGTSPDQMPFSPSFLYNQIALEGCQGAYMLDAMQTLQQVGTVPFKDFGYDERTCRNVPDRSELESASRYRIKGFNRLTLGAGDYAPDVQGIKQNLAQGAPVVIGMLVGGTFMQNMIGEKVWQPTQRDYSKYGFGGHAMCVIGYDDNLAGGAFQIMNSWGPEWGENGVGWVRYEDFEYFTKEAYGMHPMGAANDPNFDPNKLAIKFGLVDNATQTLIPLRKTAANLYGTATPVRIGQKFKVAVTNSVECNMYIFGEETDGSSYVLFPYTEKHSPYCGVVGTRVFPKDYSMVADNLGTKDRIAVVVTKEAIDYNQLNQLINSSRQRGYALKVQEVLSSVQAQQANFTATPDGAIDISAALNGKNAIWTVIEIDKR